MTKPTPPYRKSPWELEVGPPPEAWDDWVELDPDAWPKREERHYRIVPTICFNCESACGLLGFVDKADGQIKKFEGNPVHPGSRGRTCAKGPATINQINDAERILHPLKRVGPRGSGKFEQVSWEEALEDIGGRIRKAIDEDRHDEVMYHVGRPGDDHFVSRMLTAWGVDGHNSHTNVCSASARTGYAFWCGADRPSPDYSEAKFALLLSAHLETGHYFNPHAQRIIDAKKRGMRIAVVDTRLSNTATHANHWISTWPGTESALLLGVAHELLESGRIDRTFVERWTNWREYLEVLDAGGPGTFDRFLELLTQRYAAFTPEFVAQECRIAPELVTTLADEIAAADGKFTSHLWRNTASGNLGGWQVARCLMLLHVLTGSFGTPGGLNPNAWDKFVPKPSSNPPPITRWNELIWPIEWPLAHYEMSFILPHLLEDQDKRVEVYFTRVYNPVWTNPDGCSWVRMLEDEARIGCHVALTPTWSETAQWADYVLPMGLGPERHDLMSQETHAGTWIGFRQPVQLEYRRKEGEALDKTLGTNPGSVWEEAEFWIALTHRIDPDGSRGIRQWYESKAKPGAPIPLDEYYADIFENSVPGLPEAAAKEGLTPLAYMRRYGAFDVPYAGQTRYENEGEPLSPSPNPDTHGKVGFKTPSGRLEVYSKTLATWSTPDKAQPAYIRSHVHWSNLDSAGGEMVLLPTFRLPTLIHTRSANAKWLQEISHTNPLWVHPEDAERLGLENGELVRVQTGIGYFVPRAWVTEGIHPGVVACSHHVGRWRLFPTVGGEQDTSALVELVRKGDTFLFRQKQGAQGYASDDKDTNRIWWNEVGVNQNLTFPVQPDPVSGMHCWHQKVTVSAAQPTDQYGDVFVDTAQSRRIYEEWKAMAKPGPVDGLRRPLWLNRPLHPTPDAYKV
ncbi:MAG: molybdopterin-dependent oxidoreductase [Planctomycetota bacterium]|nr:molybdopterin-dependent oxidoreductase [Planctomycetota bacterium]